MKIFLTYLKRLGCVLLMAIVFIIGIFVVVQFATTPTNDRVWNGDQTILPYAVVNGNLVSIYNIRNFSYASTTSYTPHYYDKVFGLNELKQVWYVVEPFSGVPGSAHTFLSFEFEGDHFVSISVEIRKEKGESFHPLKGLFNQYELMYVIADERDVIKLRSNYRKDLVYLYPAQTPKENMQKLFLDMITRANNLREHPEFYNTLTNTCTTNIVRHINSIIPQRIPLLNLRILLPENSDRLAYDLGLIQTNLPFDETRKRYFINDRALKYADDPDFSIRIRAED